VYIAPLTTVGNLPFRRIMKRFGADITCGEMAMCTNLLAGQSSEWALLRRHPSEDVFGVQIAAAHPDQFGRCAELLEEYCHLDFVDVNCGCPIDLVCDKGAGSSLMTRPKKIVGLADALTKQLTCPVTIKMRIGWNENKPVAHQIIRAVEELNTGRIAAFMIHGRSRLQRYSSTANWTYIASVAKVQPSLQLLLFFSSHFICVLLLCRGWRRPKFHPRRFRSLATVTYTTSKSGKRTSVAAASARAACLRAAPSSSHGCLPRSKSGGTGTFRLQNGSTSSRRSRTTASSTGAPL
jgi:hypothetical protein